MKIGFLVDATCDLPAALFESGDLLVMPIGIRVGDQHFRDERNHEVTLSFLDSEIARKASEAETNAITVEEVRELFLRKLVVEFDYVFCLTVTRNRSQTFENATQASFGILNDYHDIRKEAGRQGPFSMRVLDTGALFCAQAIPVLAGLDAHAAGDAPPLIRARIEQAIRHTHGYVVVPDLYYVSRRGRAKGDKSVSPVSAMIGGALDIKPILYGHAGETRTAAKVRGFDKAAEKMLLEVATCVRRGLLIPHVTLSYAGPVEKLRKLPGYQELATACQSQNATLHETTMSLTGAINLGAGAVSVGFASQTPPAMR